MQFSRTVGSETSKGPTLIALMRHSGWRKAVILMSTDDVWFQSGLQLAKQLHADGIQVLKPAAFEPGLFRDATLQEIKRSGIRIAILMAFDDDLIRVASRAALEGMSTAWAWIMIDYGCNDCSALLYMGWLYIRAFLPSEGMQGFAKQVSDYTRSSFNITISKDSVSLDFSAALHDAITLYAHAATKVLSVGGDLHDGEAVTEAVRSVSFEGVGGGLVALDEHGDRIQSYEVMNYVVETDARVVGVPVGVYDSANGLYHTV